jgi:hypothetical protein
VWEAPGDRSVSAERGCAARACLVALDYGWWHDDRSVQELSAKSPGCFPRTLRDTGSVGWA